MCVRFIFTIVHTYMCQLPAWNLSITVTALHQHAFYTPYFIEIIALDVWKSVGLWLGFQAFRTNFRQLGYHPLNFAFELGACGLQTKFVAKQSFSRRPYRCILVSMTAHNGFHLQTAHRFQRVAGLSLKLLVCVLSAQQQIKSSNTMYHTPLHLHYMPRASMLLLLHTPGF